MIGFDKCLRDLLVRKGFGRVVGMKETWRKVAGSSNPNDWTDGWIVFGLDDGSYMVEHREQHDGRGVRSGPWGYYSTSELTNWLLGENE